MALKKSSRRLRVSQCGKAKNKRFPYSSVTMRRSLGAYRHSAVADNAVRLVAVKGQYGLADPSRAKRAQLCRYVVVLRRKPAAGSKAHSLRGYLKRRTPVMRKKLPKCRSSFSLCGRSCISQNLTCRKKRAMVLLPLPPPPALLPM
jgi:hypothetical protein